MRKDILVIYFGNEQIHLGKEQNSNRYTQDSQSGLEKWAIFKPSVWNRYT